MQRIEVRTSPILLFPLCYANTIGPAICTLPVGEAQRIKKIHKNFSLALRIRHALPVGVAMVPRFAFKRSLQHSANNGSQYNLCYIARSASPIFPELAYKLDSTDWKWKYGKNKLKPN